MWSNPGTVVAIEASTNGTVWQEVGRMQNANGIGYMQINYPTRYIRANVITLPAGAVSRVSVNHY
jgi:hypothetical protein